MLIWSIVLIWVVTRTGNWKLINYICSQPLMPMWNDLEYGHVEYEHWGAAGSFVICQQCLFPQPSGDIPTCWQDCNPWPFLFSFLSVAIHAAGIFDHAHSCFIISGMPSLMTNGLHVLLQVPSLQIAHPHCQDGCHHSATATPANCIGNEQWWRYCNSAGIKVCWAVHNCRKIIIKFCYLRSSSDL